MIHPVQALCRLQADEYDRLALGARTPAENRSYRHLAREARLQAIIAGMESR